MANNISSTCIKHPGFQATGRCKQCGKPFCSQCEVNGPTGVFCCEECKKSHEVFTQRAAQLDSMVKKPSIVSKLISLIKSLAGIIILLGLLGLIVHFIGFDVPIISDLINNTTQ